MGNTEKFSMEKFSKWLTTNESSREYSQERKTSLGTMCTLFYVLYSNGLVSLDEIDRMLWETAEQKSLREKDEELRGTFPITADEEYVADRRRRMERTYYGETAATVATAATAATAAEPAWGEVRARRVAYVEADTLTEAIGAPDEENQEL